jgi:Gpi18-like mannosyltransferase
MSRNSKQAIFLISSNNQIPGSIILILVISIITKISCLFLNSAEYTDGIIQLQLWNSPVVFFPPGYSSAVWFVNLVIPNLLISGRIVSIIASIISIWVFYKLAILVLNDKNQAFWATVFFSLSPIYNRWSIRVMTDSLFLLFFIISFYYSVYVLIKRKNTIIQLIFWSGIASLVRYQGFFFIPIILFGIYRLIASEQKYVSFRSLILGLVSLTPWIILIWWMNFKGFGHTNQFVERASYGFLITLAVYWQMFENFILYWPWAVSYSLCILGGIGLYTFCFGDKDNKYFFYYSCITVIVFLVVQSCFLSFQYRYLLPLVPLWCLFAAKGLNVFEENLTNQTIINSLKFIVISNLVLMTFSVLYFQRNTFGEIAESARFLNSAKFQRIISKENRIISDEIYRENVYNVKMDFFANLDEPFDRKIHYIRLTKPKVGDVIILHNSYSDLELEKKILDEKFEYSVIQKWDNFVTIPLLPDIMVFPPKFPLTSNPPCMAFRFTPQNYYAVVLQITKEKV